MLDFISIDAWTMFAQWANLCILFVLFKKFLFKPVQDILAKRQAEIDNAFTEAEQAEQSAKEMKAEYETRLSSAKEEAADIVKSATQRAAQRSEEMLGATKAEISALRQKADVEIETDRKKAAGELKGDIAGIALDIAGKVVEKEIDPAMHKALIDAFIDQVGDAS